MKTALPRLNPSPINLQRLRKLVVRKKGIHSFCAEFECYEFQGPIKDVDVKEAYKNRTTFLVVGDAYDFESNLKHEWLLDKTKTQKKGELVYLPVMRKESNTEWYPGFLQVCDPDGRGSHKITSGGCPDGVFLYEFSSK